MAVAPDGRSEPAMIHHPARYCAPQRSHGDKDHSDDGNLIARVDSKGRYINAEVVAPVRYGHEGNPGNASMAAVLGLGTVTAQVEKFFDANDDRKYSQQAQISFGDHERKQGPGCAD